MDIDRIVKLDVKDIDYSRDKILARFETELPESEDLEALYNSIKTDGVLEPIIVRPKGANRYEIIAGNRRLKSAKRAKLDLIPAIITDLDDIQARRVAYIENVHRKDLSPIQKAKGITALYKDIGIPKEIAIMKVKHIHNFNQRNIAEAHVSNSGNAEMDEIVKPTPEFLEVFKSIALSANTQYQLLQLVTELPKTTQEKIEENELNKAKATLLTHTKLRGHPELQRILVDQIKDLSLPQATTKVRQAISDLETGALIKAEEIGGGYNVDNYAREKVTEKPHTESFNSYMLDYHSAMIKLIGKIIQRPIARGETFYDKKIVAEKCKELEKKLRTVKKADRERFAITADIMSMVCKTIIEAAQ